MPTGSLPKSGKDLWEKVYKDAKAKGDSEEKAAKKAWGAVKQAGWSKDENGKWHKSADLQEFSLVISKAAYDKASTDASKRRTWAMVASDTEADSYNDSMSLELFSDFINRANAKEQPPETYRSDFWSGGLPYLSISHYPDLNGDAVPGVVEEIYVDGNRFKAKGYYYDNPIGRSTFESVCNDLYNPERQNADDKVRVSIAFLDYKHRHKDSDFVFERSEVSDSCPECMKELIEFALEGKEPQGKEFLRGHLIHLAHTRVPVNTRTSLEVDKSMTTRKEDAASIVGEELAKDIDEKASLVGKSEALVVKSDEQESTEKVEDTATELVEESKTEKPKKEDEEDGEGDCSKKVKKSDINKSDVVPVEVVNVVTTDELQTVVYKPFGGATSLKEAKETIDAQKEQWRISDLWYALQSVIENIFSNDELDDKSSAVAKAVDEFKDMIGDKSATLYNALLSLSKHDDKQFETHPLDTVLGEFKAAYDEVNKSELAVEEKLLQMQSHYEKLAVFVRDSMLPKQPEVPQAPPTSTDKAITALSEAVGALIGKMDVVITKMSTPYQPNVSPTVPAPAPVRRSLDPANINSWYPKKQSTTPSIDRIVEMTT
jgi:hypothetical protein